MMVFVWKGQWNGDTLVGNAFKVQEDFFFSYPLPKKKKKKLFSKNYHIKGGRYSKENVILNFYLKPSLAI